MAFAIILPILAYALGTATYDAVTSYRDAQMIDRQNAAANNLIAGVYEILMERLATNNALLAEQPAGGDVLKEIDVRRSVAVKKIGAAFEDLSAQEFPAKAALLAELKGAIDKANGYRAKADAAVKQAQGRARRRHGEEPVRLALGAVGDRRRRSGPRFCRTPAGSTPSWRASPTSASWPGTCATPQASSARISRSRSRRRAPFRPTSSRRSAKSARSSPRCGSCCRSACARRICPA